MQVSQIETKPATRPSVEQLVADLRRMAELLEASMVTLACSPADDSVLGRDYRKRLANIRSTITVLELASPLSASEAKTLEAND